jgi:hypothetical protein
MLYIYYWFVPFTTKMLHEIVAFVPKLEIKVGHRDDHFVTVRCADINASTLLATLFSHQHL